MGQMLYMLTSLLFLTNPESFHHAVIGGGVGAVLFACTTLEKDETVDGSERVQLAFGSGVGARDVPDVRATHRPLPDAACARLHRVGVVDRYLPVCSSAGRLLSGGLGGANRAA